MIPITTMAGRKVAVFGMARSGLAASAALLAGGAEVHAWDDGARGREAAAAHGLTVTDLAATGLDSYDALVLAPGVPLTHPKPHWSVLAAKAAGVPVIGDTELFFHERAARGAGTTVLAITGTNGKSTTTALTAHVIASAGRPTSMGGNIGAAVLSLEDFTPGRIYVVELSSYQIDLTPTLTADAAALLNITPDHLDRHGSLAGYAAVKEAIFARLPAGGAAVVSLDDAHCGAIARRLDPGLAARPVSVERRLNTGFWRDGRDLVETSGGLERARLTLANAPALPGPHNAQNACAAWLLARAAGLSDGEVQAGLETFPGLEHRLEVVGRYAGALVVNDSKATNAEAAAHALRAFENIHWIVGGRAKDGGVATLRALMAHVSHAYLIGEAATQLAGELEGHVPFSAAGTIEQAVADAFKAIAATPPAAADAGAAQIAMAHPPVLLLSPACASFDQFPDFEARGRAFKHAVVRHVADAQISGEG